MVNGFRSSALLRETLRKLRASIGVVRILRDNELEVGDCTIKPVR